MAGTRLRGSRACRARDGGGHRMAFSRISPAGRGRSLPRTVPAARRRVVHQHPTPAVRFVVEYEGGRPPPVFPREGRILIMRPFKLTEAKGGCGLLELFGDPGTPAWPPTVHSVMSYRCEVISSAATSLFDVEVTFNLRFKKDDPRGTVSAQEDSISGTWTFQMPCTAPPGRVVFYAFNNWIPEYIEMTARFATYKTSPEGPPQIARVRIAGALGERIVLTPVTPTSPPASNSHAQSSDSSVTPKFGAGSLA